MTPNVPTEPEPEPPEEGEEEEPDPGEECQTDDGAIDMCCLCCGEAGQTQPICVENPQIVEQCRLRPEGCGPSQPVDGECGRSRNTCAVGTYRDAVDSETHYYWECLGRHGGRLAYCYEPRSSDPGFAFDGQWTLASIIRQSCSQVEGKGEMRVDRSGDISGWFQHKETVRTGDGIYRRNVRQTLDGQVGVSGAVNGTFQYEGRTLGSFTGTLGQRTGSGTWNDTAGCVGTWNARKQRE